MQDRWLATMGFPFCDVKGWQRLWPKSEWLEFGRACSWSRQVTVMRKMLHVLCNLSTRSSMYFATWAPALTCRCVWQGLSQCLGCPSGLWQLQVTFQAPLLTVAYFLLLWLLFRMVIAQKLGSFMFSVFSSWRHSHWLTAPGAHLNRRVWNWRGEIWEGLFLWIFIYWFHCLFLAVEKWVLVFVLPADEVFD